MEKLLTHFDSSTAYKLYVIAILRCAYPKAVNRDLKFYYETSLCLNYLKRLVYLNHYYQTFEKTGRAYSNIHNQLDRINEFKGRVQIIDGTLKSYNSDEELFLNDQEKARLKVAKILPYFTLGLIYQRANLSQTIPRKYADRLFLRTFWKMCLALGNISCW
nr:hypothetical protein [Mycoplasmopsis bovis]